jgi:hypothetical protein
VLGFGGPFLIKGRCYTTTFAEHCDRRAIGDAATTSSACVGCPDRVDLAKALHRKA